MKPSRFNAIIRKIDCLIPYSDTQKTKYNELYNLDVKSILNRLTLQRLIRLSYVFPIFHVPIPKAVKLKISEHYKHYWLICCAFDTGKFPLSIPKEVCLQITNLFFNLVPGIIEPDLAMEDIIKAKVMEDEIVHNDYIMEAVYTQQGTPKHTQELLKIRRDDLLTAYKKQEMSLDQIFRLHNYQPYIKNTFEIGLILSHNDIIDMPNRIIFMMALHSSVVIHSFIDTGAIFSILPKELKANILNFYNKASYYRKCDPYITYPFYIIPKEELCTPSFP